MKFEVNEVVQFNELHKWRGCLGIVEEIKSDRIMVGVPVPQQGTAYVFCKDTDLEYIGDAVLTIQKDNEEDNE